MSGFDDPNGSPARTVLKPFFDRTTSKWQLEHGRSKFMASAGPTPGFVCDDKFGDVLMVMLARGWRRCESGDPTTALVWRNLANTPFDLIR